MAQILALSIPVSGPIRKVYLNNHYSDFNAHIGAMVGTVASSPESITYGKLDAWIDDEGLLVGASYNSRLTEIINYPYGNSRYPWGTNRWRGPHRLYGDGLILTHNEDGETVSLSEVIADVIIRQYNTSLYPSR